jgi:hypothetical protein
MSSPPKRDLLRPLGSRPKTPGKKDLRERVCNRRAAAAVFYSRMLSTRQRPGGMQNDRFISNRSATDFENAHLLEQLDTGGSVRSLTLRSVLHATLSIAMA